ncbi:MAG: Sulfur carrier protein adenylyltransferase ThiF [Pedosphaera sp.]|nr:Sulfur carrier protein adenylyltransferase ThiF [Pedosphaera sp.]
MAGEVKATPLSLELSADYISRALDAMIDAGEGVGLALVHTHPPSPDGAGVAAFSLRDDWYDLRLVPTFLATKRDALFGSIVIGAEPGTVDARIWWNGDRGLSVQPADILRLVGPEVRFIELRASKWRDHPDPTLMDRSTRIWGREGRRILQNIRAGVVGLGGTGSITFLSLATMGIGKLNAWEKDMVGKENLHRLLGVTKKDIGRAKGAVFKKAARRTATADPFELKVFDDWGTSAKGLRQLKDCDVIFSCVDKLAARVPICDLAYAHLIPTLDMASWIHPNKGIVDAIMSQAQVLSPGLPCSWCSGTLSSRALTLEAQGTQQGVEHRAAYGLQVIETEGIEPSVLPLNLTSAGLALLQFMQVALHVTDRTPNKLRLMLPQWELDESDLAARTSCSCMMDSALGDTLHIRPYAPPQDASGKSNSAGSGAN